MIDREELKREIQKFLREYSETHELNGTILIATGDDIVATASCGIAIVKI